MIFLQVETIGSVIWFFLFFVFIFLYPRLMLSQLIYKIEQSCRKMEQMSESANAMVARKITSAPSAELKNKISAFSDFFVVEPSTIDPYGVVQRLDVLVRQMEWRFEEFVNDVANDKDAKERQELNYGLRAAMSLRQIAKIVRHNVELAKKFKNLQIAMILQMQLPIIEKIAESELKGTEAFVKGLPVGDSIGPLVAANLMEKPKFIAEDVVMDTTTIAGRTCFVMKATGPSPHLGRIDEALQAVMRKHRIERVITIDAALKLEGEKSGSVCEGVGFAMGGFQRELIERTLLPKKIPLDSVVVKVGLMEAITPMKKEIYDAVPNVRTYVETAAKRVRKGGKVIIIGVGNSSGIGDSRQAIKDVKPIVEKIDRAYKAEEKATKKKKGWV